MLNSIRNLEEFNQKHKGKSAIILASGPSLIDEIENFSYFPKFVTIAVNSGYAAYETDYFVSDDWETKIWHHFAISLKRSNKTIALLYEDKLGDQAHLFGERSVIYRHRLGYYMTSKYEHDNYDNYIMQCRSSLGSAIHIAFIMGIKSIMILGLDCCRKQKYRWFWQLPEWKNKAKRLDGKKEDKYRWRKQNHIDTDSDLIDILNYWNKHGAEINKKCTVYNGSKISQVKVFPYKSLKDFINGYQ